MYIEKRYKHVKIQPVDNALSDTNDMICCLSDLEKIEWEKNDSFLIIASDNENIYNEIRVMSNRIVPNEYILDLTPINPLCHSPNPRIASMAIAAGEVYRNNIKGCIAEAGVYRGDCAKYLNILFPDRKMYLFDSFSGFEDECIEEGDSEQQVTEWKDNLKDTSVELVLSKMRNRHNVVVKKGYVPDTLHGIDESFCFVNLDMDLYKPTLEALRFFWKKLNRGGIFIFMILITGMELLIP